MKKIFFIILVISSCISALAFDAGTDNQLNAGIHFLYIYYRELAFLKQDTAAPVKIQLEKTSFNDMAILFIPDTAKQSQDIASTFGKDYGELMRFVQENQLVPRKFLAWYYSVQPPWKMDIAVEVDKIPSELKGRINSRTEKGGEVLIAHVRGPYSELGKAYSEIESWLKQNKRIAKGNPFEVYLNDPSTVKDPSEIQTDIYQPLQ